MESMDEIYRRHSKMIYYVLLSKVNNPDLAEELTQETFYQALKSFHTFAGRSSVSTWLCGISNHVYQTWCRKQKYSMDIEQAEYEIMEEPLEKAVFLEWESKEILRHLHSLKDPMREVMYLRLIGNLSFQDIGEIMEKSENWARVNFYRGKEKIVEEVRKHERKNTL
ncbi:RNA polymerase sigma factor [Lacrimispora sp.]|uniref:RNA polymerase sigma factor n=1 Tax=Lacrimispora sp. TaxID=2719234 RepID=UPI003992A185